jgi:hypothetical protein
MEVIEPYNVVELEEFFDYELPEMTPELEEYIADLNHHYKISAEDDVNELGEIIFTIEDNEVNVKFSCYDKVIDIYNHEDELKSFRKDIYKKIIRDSYTFYDFDELDYFRKLLNNKLKKNVLELSTYLDKYLSGFARTKSASFK